MRHAASVFPCVALLFCPYFRIWNAPRPLIWDTHTRRLVNAHELQKDSYTEKYKCKINKR